MKAYTHVHVHEQNLGFEVCAVTNVHDLTYCSWQVVGLGVRGAFTIIQDVWQTMPGLCLRALRAFLDILQGQSPAGLRREPKETTGLQCIATYPWLKR